MPQVEFALLRSCGSTESMDSYTASEYDAGARLNTIQYGSLSSEKN